MGVCDCVCKRVFFSTHCLLSQGACTTVAVLADPAKLAKLLGEKSARLVKKKKKKGGSSMRASDQLTADDYITPYMDDEDTDVEE